MQKLLITFTVMLAASVGNAASEYKCKEEARDMSSGGPQGLSVRVLSNAKFVLDVQFRDSTKNFQSEVKYSAHATSQLANKFPFYPFDASLVYINESESVGAITRLETMRAEEFTIGIWTSKKALRNFDMGGLSFVKCRSAR